MRQLRQLGCDSRQGLQFCYLGTGRLEFCADCKEQFHDLVRFTSLCWAYAQGKQLAHVVLCWPGLPILELVVVVVQVRSCVLGMVDK